MLTVVLIVRLLASRGVAADSLLLGLRFSIRARCEEAAPRNALRG